jgi:ADP-ribosyl-[dinitrogen reductase] hydrolase
MTIKRKRGTAIVDTPKGILVAAGKHKIFLLPGGGVNKYNIHGFKSSEGRESAAIRELEEETSMIETTSKFLFTFHEPHINPDGPKVRNYHKVFFIKATGIPKPSHHDVKYVDYWTPESNITISPNTKTIIDRYLKFYKPIIKEKDLNKAFLEKYKFNPCQNMLLGIAFGDACGAGFENKKRADTAKKFQLEHYTRKKDYKKGKYTDDTQMSIAVAELLLSGKEFNTLNLADSFVEVYRRNPHSGYGSSVKQGLKHAKNGKDLLNNIPGDSQGNGACMRASPIGILPNLKEVINYAIINAKITHNVPSAVASSVAIATAAHYFYYNLGEPIKVFDYVINACKEIDNESIEYFKKIKDMKTFNPELLFGRDKIDFGVPVNGMRTAGAVLYLISRINDPTQILKEAILLGGDTDSTASLSLGIIAINQGIKNMPTFLFNDLENKGYGRDYLIELGEKLFLKYHTKNL